jgi:methylmalonyl-CoA/ethylmalonyl-CoA epimerase
MSDPFTFHHVGLATRSLERERAAHQRLGFVEEGPTFEDPRQKIRGQFLRNGGFRVELLEPLGEDSPLHDWLRRGQKMYHQAFEVPRLEEAIAALRREGALLAVPPCPAVAFGGRSIAFLLLRTELLVELIEAPAPAA